MLHTTQYAENFHSFRNFRKIKKYAENAIYKNIVISFIIKQLKYFITHSFTNFTKVW